MRALWITFAILIADQVTKVWVKTHMYLGESIPVVGDLLKWTFTENPGMAFGLELGSKVFLTVFSVLATILIGAYLWHVRTGPLGYRVALALVLGGALGNVVDRVAYGRIWGYADWLYGKVVDFIHVDLGVVSIPDAVPLLGGKAFQLFPIGNIADLAIIAGVVLIVITQGAFQEWVAKRHAAELLVVPGAAAGTPAPEVSVEPAREGAPLAASPAPLADTPTFVEVEPPENEAGDESTM